MALQLLIAVLSGLLRLCLWGATLAHAGLIAWDRLYVVDLPKEYQIPTHWADFLGLGATPFTFWAYLATLAVNLVWQSSRQKNPSPQKSGLFNRVSSGEIALFFWALGDGLAHYALSEDWIKAMPVYLDQTLAGCFLLWIGQKLMEMAFRRRQLPTPALVKSPSLPVPQSIRAGETPVAPTEPEISSVTKVMPDRSATGETAGTIPPKPKSRVKRMAKRRAPAAPKGRGKSKASEALEKNILDFIRLKGQAKTAELKKELGVTDRTINRYQKKLLAEGRLEKVGNGKLAAYRLRGPSPETLMKGEALAMPDGPARAEFIEEAGPVQGSNPSNQGME